MRGIQIAVLTLFALICIALPIQAASWQTHIPQAQALGSGELRWFGLRIYSAQLWGEKKPFDTNAPFALALTYHRNISRAQFVETSVAEIERLFGTRYPVDTLKRWEGEMYRAFTDVKPGDQLIGVSMPNQGVLFYSQRELLADIRDPEFAKAFFGIWFDIRTKDQDLRAQLLGNSP